MMECQTTPRSSTSGRRAAQTRPAEGADTSARALEENGDQLFRKAPSKAASNPAPPAAAFVFLALRGPAELGGVNHQITR